MLTKEIDLTMLDGSTRSLADFAGKVVLVVNVASRCGLSPQYQTLEKLQKTYQDRGFTVLGVPSGSFKQELKDDEAIEEYCSSTWGVTFPLTQKTDVNGRKRHELYKKLEIGRASCRERVGPVMWNFEKFLLLPDGNVLRFRPTVKPDAPEIIEAIEANLPG